MDGGLRISPYGRHALALVFSRRDLDLSVFRFIIRECLGEHGEQVLCMLWGDAHDRFCTCLVYPGDLVEKDEGKFVILVCYLDHIAVDRIEVLGNIDRNLVLGHTVYFDCSKIKTWQTVIRTDGVAVEGMYFRSAVLHKTRCIQHD